QDATPDGARALLKRGAYKEAIAAFTALLQKNPRDRDAIEGLTRAQIETGDYETAEKRLRAFLFDRAGDAAARCQLADIELETGRYADAAADFGLSAKDTRGIVALRANLGLARALIAQGKEEQAKSPLVEVGRFYSENQPRSAEELTIVAQAFALLEKY